MGMPIGIDVRDVGVNPAVIAKTFDRLRRADATFSTYRPDSDISRLNAGMADPIHLDPDVRAVLDRCDEIRRQTDGYFDIRTDHLPIELVTASGEITTAGIDPSGLVKGWAVDRAAEILDAAGVRNYSINAGGDVRVRGGALPDPFWRIGIQHPFVPDRVAAVVQATDLAIATSGTYARGEHIVNPHTGRPPRGVLSVTITGPDLATADAYATAIYAMGQTGPAWSAWLTGYESMTILDNETVVSTRGFPFAPREGADVPLDAS